MRWTLHVVTAHDCLSLRPLVQPVMEQRMRAQLGRHLGGVDLDELVALGRAYVDQEPRSLGDIGRLLAERWPESRAEHARQRARRARPARAGAAARPVGS